MKFINIKVRCTFNAKGEKSILSPTMPQGLLLGGTQSHFGKI